MDLKTKLRYQGCITTPSLWTDGSVFPFNQIELNNHPETIDDGTVFKNHRLGKLVEEFIFQQLKNQPSTSWVCDNLQIQQDQRTVGEIDALYYDNGHPIHLEIVYKFYLYDTLENYTNPLGYWIGPNRKDSLPYKLAKLQNKQFPLLYHEASSPYLTSYQLEAKAIKQALCFKAQLFLPYRHSPIDFGPLNSDCVVGFYLNLHQLEQFNSCAFFIPEKLDWLIEPHQNVHWVSYAAALASIETSVSNQRSPLIWIRHNDHKINKCFVVFW